MRIVVCLAWAPRRVDVDPLTGEVSADDRDFGLSAADAAALEVALSIAQYPGVELVAATVGPVEADELLRTAIASGADSGTRIHHRERTASDVTAVELARVCRGSELVLCGDATPDRGSGAVPALLAAELGWPQALGAVALGPADPDAGDPQRAPTALLVDRRLDRGARERLEVTLPAVVSVEGTVARLRRAPLTGLLAAGHAELDVLDPLPHPVGRRTRPGEARPHRPRPRPCPGPDSTAPPLARQLQLTAAAEQRTPPRTLRLQPRAAAHAIIEQLQEWGYLPGR